MRLIRFVRAVSLCLFLFAACTTDAQAQQAQTVLVVDGQPQATIVLAADASRDQTTAANELQTHIELMSGATLPIVHVGEELGGSVRIYIGAAAPAPELERIAAENDDPAAFRLHVAADQIQIVGNGDAGVLAGTYELLEQLGVRWLIPMEIGLDVPEATTVRLDHQDLIEGPAFIGRTLQAIGDAEWARRQRLGGFNAGAHGLGPRFDRETEPELFYHEDGEPTIQENVTHPEVLRRVIEHWRGRLEANPDMPAISVGPHDGLGFGTTDWDADDFDPIMGKPATTDRYIKFFNLILDDLHQDFPDVRLAFYAYTLEMRPPVRETPNPKILPMLAAIGLDRFHSINNPLSWEKQYLKTVIEGWQAAGVEMMFRGYLFNLADHGLPFSMIDIVREEWPYYHDKGFIAMRVECLPNWAYHAPALYLAARLYWDPQQDSDAILDEWFERMYGPAASAMKEHSDIIDNACIHGDYYTGNVYDVPKIVTPEVRLRMGETLARAEEVAGSGNKHADRVRLVRIGYEYGEANFKMMDAFFNGDFVEAKVHRDHIGDELIPLAIEHRPAVITPRIHVAYFNRFWAVSVDSAYERVTDGHDMVALLPDEWLFFLDPYGAGEDLMLHRPGIGTQPWQPINTRSKTASNQGLRYYKDGSAWYRTTVTVDEAYAGRPLRIWFGGIDDTAEVWINGEPCELITRGAAPLGRPWIFDATDALEPGEDNLIVVKVTDTFVNELGTFGINGPVMIYAEPAEQ